MSMSLIEALKGMGTGGWLMAGWAVLYVGTLMTLAIRSGNAPLPPDDDDRSTGWG